ncbi:hypothetical protein JOD97_003675 [Duganella sp. 1411]|uniref:hypothetical protein n=1 Tax=Duganella sp. 1411 TaxID=2806572 RepID=UPI001AE61962|nr:hypothetical protein [Duganella sp. 1411]MBP1205613.1 hypothetical protein [Duganella sp. 1411]
MRSMTIEELNAIAGASTVGDAVGCAGAIAGATALIVGGPGSAALNALMATTQGALSVLSVFGGMVSGCINLYDGIAPPEWQTSQLIDDFFNVIDTVAYYSVHTEQIIEDLPTMTGHVEIIYQGETFAEFDYDFTDDPAYHT